MKLVHHAIRAALTAAAVFIMLYPAVCDASVWEEWRDVKDWVSAEDRARWVEIDRFGYIYSCGSSCATGGSGDPNIELIKYDSNGNEIKSPWLKIRDEASKVMRRLENEFGMTPSSATQFHERTPGNAGDDDADDFEGLP